MAPTKPVPRLENAIPSLALAKQMEGAYERCLLRYTQSLARYRPDAGATMQAIAGGQMIFSGPSPFSVAVGVAVDHRISPAEFRQIEDFFCHRRIRSAIEVCPYSHPSLLDLLQAHGYRVGDVSTVLCRDLGSAVPVPDQSGPGVCVRWAEAHEAELWADILIRLFYATDPGPDVRANLVALFHVPDSLNGHGGYGWAGSRHGRRHAAGWGRSRGFLLLGHTAAVSPARRACRAASVAFDPRPPAWLLAGGRKRHTRQRFGTQPAPAWVQASVSETYLC